MKKTLYLLMVPLILCMAFIYRESSLTENTSSKNTSIQNLIVNNKQVFPAPQNNRFLFGAMDTYTDHVNNYRYYDTLGFNLWHTYNDEYDDPVLGRKTPKGRVAQDILTADINTYSSALVTLLNNLHSQQNNNSVVLWCRPKIEWLTYGQSSTYEAEQLLASDPLWFYSFNISNGSSVPDPEWNGGKYVLHCSGSGTGQNEGYVLKNLKANTEQCRNDEYWQGDSEGAWYIKPRIRIDSNIVDTAPNTLVCNISIVDETGNNILKTIDLRARNFLDNNNNYDGKYKEEFRLFSGDDSLLIHGAWGNKWWYSARGNWLNDVDSISNHADIRVYWYDNCEMWIDYVKVENDIADELMNPNNPNHVRDSLWIKNEVEQITNKNTRALYKYYVEHFEFNNLPCVKYVNDKLKLYSGGSAELLTDFDDWYGAHLRWGQHASSHTSEYIYNNIISKAGFSTFFFESYPLTSKYIHNVQNINDTYCRIPVTLPKHSGDSILAWHVTPAEYDLYLQQQLDDHYNVTSDNSDYPYTTPVNLGCGEGPLDRDNGNFTYYMKLANEMQRNYGLTFLNMPQAHQWFRPIEVRREPTNEELDLLANLPVSYGAKGLIYFFYPSVNYPGTCMYYGKGMYDETGVLRKQNVYQQVKLKYDKIKEIGDRMKIWEPFVMNFDDSQTKSFIYRIDEERLAMFANSYIFDVYSYKHSNSPYPCTEDFPQGDTPPQGIVGECRPDRYIQAATFENTSEQNTNYFMLVNRRCSPHYLPGQDSRFPNGEEGGYRQMKINFKPNAPELSGFDNWNIIDVEKPFTVAGVYHKGDVYVDLGWFEPGQGKLYRMIPTSINGGILAGDEVIHSGNFTCEAPVYNNGHNITIEAGTTIHFNDSSRFVMNGGTFTVGDQNTNGSQNITCDAVNGSSWLGHSFTNCNVRIYGADFSGIANDTAYSLNLVDCPVVDIRNCTFNSEQSVKGAVNAVYYNNQLSQIENVYLYGNTFNSSGSTIPTVNISSYAGLTLPLIIENNTFNYGNTAIFLNGVTGGAIKGNTITDNYYSINALTSSVDIAENNITSSVNGSIGVFSAGGSEIRLSKAGNLVVGGHNNITNTGTGSNNIRVEGAVFLLDDGENVFDIASNQSAYHLNGWFPYFTAVSYSEIHNCWKVDGTTVNPVSSVTDGYQGSPISFTFTPYLTGCEVSTCEDYTVINLGDGIFDSVCTGTMGEGGSESGIQKRAFDLQGSKQKYDSISVLMRYRNYTQARIKCLDLINMYPDSIQCLNAISKLYLAVTATDTSSNGITELKTYYENLILNHPNNISLVKRANYYILKCKVRLHLYSQALAGFQQIINENPYSYEGLIARWDYMATSLLVQGQGGGEQPIKNYELGIMNSESDKSYEFEEFEKLGDDKSPFTKEQRQDIRKSINTAIETGRNNDETRIKKLEEQVSLGDVNASNDLRKLRTLKEVVKSQKPANILQHVKIVSEDIRKVFGEGTSNAKTTPNNLPTVYRLSQNYPNPFNPVTKINYDLPRDAKVTLVIYDILGREVKRLVNNEIKKAGAYIVDFNAMNYASGVYFYRIEAEESNGAKFTDSKKMVLIK